MAGIPLQVAEPTGRYRRSLRRYVFSGDAECPAGYHHASNDIGKVAESEHTEASGDNWPHDDPRWPEACECGYEFTPADEWQRNDGPVYRLPDGAEFAFWGAFGKAAPPGTMIRAGWYDEFSSHPDGIESWLVALPDGGEWITSQAATGGGYWTVSGTPPLITVSPSIFHNSPAGWHGWIRAGVLDPA
jgi:hypothetical protein